MPFLKVSWRTWRPLGSIVARCSPVLLKKSKAIRRPLGDQSESALGVWVSRCWCVPSGLAAQILKSPSLGSNRVKVIRPLAGRCPGWRGRPARAAARPRQTGRPALAGVTLMPAQPRSPPAQDRRPRSSALPSAATSRRPVSATMARDRRFMFSSFVCVPNPRRDVQTVRMRHGDDHPRRCERCSGIEASATGKGGWRVQLCRLQGRVVSMPILTADAR